MSPAAIALGLNRDSIRSPRGKTRTRQSVVVVRRNNVYCGERYGVRQAHPAIVPRRLFSTVQAALAARARKT